MTPDYRALCAELVAALAEWRLGGGPPEDTADADLIDRARALLAEPEAEGPSEEELYDLADEFNGDPVPAMRAALDRWGRPAAAPVAMIELITDMAMHLAHMQELLEDYEYGDPEDYHWYRESVRLRAVAAEVLA